MKSFHDRIIAHRKCKHSSRMRMISNRIDRRAVVKKRFHCGALLILFERAIDRELIGCPLRNEDVVNAPLRPRYWYTVNGDVTPVEISRDKHGTIRTARWARRL